MLALLFVAIPMSARFDMPQTATCMGWTHGILFLFYGMTTLAVSHREGWLILRWLMVFLLGAVSLGFLYVDFQLKRLIRGDVAGEAA